MRVSYILALLGASTVTLGLPANNNELSEDGSGRVTKRFYYVHYVPSQRDSGPEDNLDKRFFYIYDPVKREV